MENENVKQIAEKLILAQKRNRETREAQIPKIPLQPQNVQNCELLLNRKMLLQKMKKNLLWQK